MGSIGSAIASCSNKKSQVRNKTNRPRAKTLSRIQINSYPSTNYSPRPYQLQRSAASASYTGGLTWNCPYCKRQNEHNYPFSGACLNDMFGTTRACKHCAASYILGQ